MQINFITFSLLPNSNLLTKFRSFRHFTDNEQLVEWMFHSGQLTLSIIYMDPAATAKTAAVPTEKLQ